MRLLTGILLGVVLFWASSGTEGLATALPLQSKPPIKSRLGQEFSKTAGSIIITKNPKSITQQLKNSGRTPLQVLHRSGNRPSFVVVSEDPASPLVKSLDSQPQTTVATNYVYRSFLTPNDTNYPQQWNLPQIAAPQAWDITTGSADTTIAVLDTGVLFEQTIDTATYTQSDLPTSKMWTNSGETGMTNGSDACWTGTPEDKQLNGCDDDGNGLVDDWRGWDFMGGFRGSSAACPNFGDSVTYQDPEEPSYVLQDNDPQPYSCDSPSLPDVLNKNHNGPGLGCGYSTRACYVGHGTMVASVAASATNNGEIIAGVNHNAKLMNMRVMDGYGFGTTALLAVSIEYAADNSADVINMSLGAACDDESFTDPIVESAIQKATDAGAAIVAASGNESSSTVCYPASSSQVLAVGATDQDDNRKSYSSYSSKLDVVAPSGVPAANAPSDYQPANYYGSVSGTSFAAPHVAGLAALLKANDPSLSGQSIMSLISERADKVPGMQGSMFHNEYGFGRINAYVPLAVTEDKLPVYRLYRPATKSHFYTTSVTERDRVVSNKGFVFEGIAFWAQDSTQNTLPIYRLYRASTKTHLFTASSAERDRVVSSKGFVYEGIGFRVLDEGAPDTDAIYRLYRASTKSHLLTASSTERDGLVSVKGFVYEGIGFRAETISL